MPVSNVLPFSRPQRGADPAGEKLQAALALMDQAHAAWQEGRRTEGIRALKEAIRLEEACLGPRSPAVATAYPLLGAYLLLEGDLSAAEAALGRALSLLERLPDRERERIATRALLVELLLKQGRAAGARDILRDLAGACEKAFGARSPEYARILLAGAQAHEALGEIGDATVSYQAALDVCDKSAGGPDMLPVLQAALGALVRLGFASGRQATALEYLDRLLLTIPDEDPES